MSNAARFVALVDASNRNQSSLYRSPSSLRLRDTHYRRQRNLNKKSKSGAKSDCPLLRVMISNLGAIEGRIVDMMSYGKG